MSYPADLDHILQRTMAVRVKVEPRNRQASVMRYSERTDFIQNLMEEMATIENTSQDSKCLAICSQNASFETNSCQIDKAKSVMSDDFDLNNSLSATADHDPDHVATITPAKRQNDETDNIDLMTPENLSAKFSSTAKSVVIKKEKS